MLVRRLQGTAGTVERAWIGKTVVCIAGGPSLTQEQLSLVRRAREADAVRVVVVNDIYLIAPWADVMYFADHRWFLWTTSGVPKSWPWAKFSADDVRKAWSGFKGQKVTIKHNPMANGPDILSLDNAGGEGLSDRPTAICTGSNSGFQALQIAVHSGGNPILLVAYDMRFLAARTHSHNGHQVRMHESAYKGYAKKFGTLQRPLEKLRVKVINCTPGSAIECFERGSLDACLQLPSSGAVLSAPGV